PKRSRETRNDSQNPNSNSNKASRYHSSSATSSFDVNNNNHDRGSNQAYRDNRETRKRYLENEDHPTHSSSNKQPRAKHAHASASHYSSSLYLAEKASHDAIDDQSRSLPKNLLRFTIEFFSNPANAHNLEEFLAKSYYYAYKRKTCGNTLQMLLITI